jgi:PAS domain S-box-containing protein
MVDPATLRLAAVVASSEDAIITETLDGAIETWNRSAERLFGYSAAEAIGRPIEIIVPPEVRATGENSSLRVLAGQTAKHFETTGLTRDGARIPISVSLSIVVAPEGQVIGTARIIRDISEHRTLEREALRLAAIVNSSEDAIVSKDLNGIVQTWNRAAERMFGYTAQEIVGRPIRLIIPADRQTEEDKVLATIRAGRAVENFETIRQRKDGTLIEISLTVSPVRARDGTVVGASKIARDISEPRRLAKRAEEAARAKDEFLAMLSHELRTPLNAVLGYTRMLRDNRYSDERREQVIDIIERNARALSQLVSDVLDVSGIVTGKVRLTLDECNVVSPLQGAVDILRPSADAKGVALRLTAPEEPLMARCDVDRMQQVFWNLLSNGVKFTPRGGVVHATVSGDDGAVTVRVTDTGIGIRRESLAFLFQRFWQAENVHTRYIGGLGLGLALARHFVELHGGTISAHSDGEGHGSTFTVALPRVQPSSTRQPVPPS